MKERYDDIDEYIADLKREIAGDEKCAIHLYNLGVAFLSKRDFAAAEEAFLSAVRASPHLAEAYVQLGGICMQRGDLEGCLHYNEEAANCRARYAIPQSNMAFVYLQKNDPDRAIPLIKKALKWDPDLLQAKNSMATALFMKGDFSGSEKISRELLASQPDFAPTWNNLALALFEQGKFHEAAKAADKAMSLGFEVAPGFMKELEPYKA